MKLNKIVASLAAVVAIALSSCSEGQYWDEPANPGDVYAFPKPTTTVSVPATDAIPTTWDVTLTRNNSGAEATIPVEFTSSSSLLTGPSSVTFAAGSTTANYTISIADGAMAGVTYSCKLSIAKPENANYVLPATNFTHTFNISKVLVLDWQPAGTAATYSLKWVGNDEPIEIPVEEAVNWPTAGQRRMRLMSPYWYLEPEYAAQGYNIEFILDDEGNAKSMYAAWQFMGETNDGEYCYFGCPANYGGYFANEGDVFIMNGVVGTATSLGGTVSPGWNETLQFQWSNYGK